MNEISDSPASPTRRRWLSALGHVGAIVVVPGLAACDRLAPPPPRAPAEHPGATAPDSVVQWLRRQVRSFDRPRISGGFVGADVERGHRLRSGDVPTPPPLSLSSPAAASRQRTRVAIVGTGVAALSAARALRRAGISDVRLFELEDSVGGNSRSGRVGGIVCPWGAHYLPVPDADAHELIELLVELGAARRDAGRIVYDERMLCHAPAERLLLDGHWQSGLLPPSPSGVGQTDLSRFASLIRQFRGSGAFRLGEAPRSNPVLQALDRQTFGDWLDALHLDSPSLRWYLDYSCRDDFGAGIDEVSAWAGVHYFASRHGFFDSEQARDADRRIDATADAEDRSDVLTWPQGNAWLIERMARPLRQQIVTGAMVTRVTSDSLDVWREAEHRSERWFADRIILAVPLMIALRVLDAPPEPLQSLAGRLRYASWRVANVQLAGVPHEMPGAPRSWDNVIHGDLASGALGYIDAMHQSLRSRPGPTVLTCYAAFGGSNDARARLLDQSWSQQAADVLAYLQRAHPDIRDHARRLDIMRWGHAMLIPTPGLRTDPDLLALRRPIDRLHFAHGDLAGYSVFEESFAIGHRAGLAVARELSA